MMQSIKSNKMKYLSFVIVILWAVWTIVNNENLKPSENYFLWLLSALSILYSIVCIVIFYVEYNSRKKLK